MRKLASLLNGIAIIIDDEVGKEANIDNLILQIKKRKMPYQVFTELPDVSLTEHFEGISFLLLDWRLQTEDLSASTIEGVRTPDQITRNAIGENIAFLKELRKCCFTPIFIFTNEDVERVITVLKDNNLYEEGKPNYIFVKSKKDLIGRTRLFKTIEDWIKKTPSIYVLKVWEKEYKKSKCELFHDLYRISPNWPIVLWKSFAMDSSSASSDLGEFIVRNLHSRMTPFAFDDKILRKSAKYPSRDEIRKVLEGERFIEKLHENSIAAGDVFKIKGDLFLNIRPDCDCIPDRSITESRIEDVELYLLTGSKLSIVNEKKKYRKQYGNFEELDSQSVVFSMKDGKTYVFRFKTIVIRKWGEIKESRIGRLLPPYITRIQQRYSLYLQRQGLLRTPEIAVLGQ